MHDIRAIGAFLDEAHAEWAEGVALFAQSALAALPEPKDDAAGREQAREIVGLLGEGWLAPIRSQDLRASCLVREALAAVSPLADAVYAIQALSGTALLLSENEAQCDAWLPRLLSGTAMGAFAMTEPGAGSDVASLATTATRDGDDYVLDGTKTFISNAGLADVYVVFATTDPERGSRGLSAFAVPAKTEGLEFVEAQVMSAPHPLGVMALNGCRVPEEARLGDEGTGFKLAMATLDRLRPTVAAAACGMAARALEEAEAHALSREQFGQPLADFQLVQDKLARMYVDLTASRLMTYRAAWEKDGGAERITVEAAMAKAYATEAAQRIVDDAIQILGGRGVLAEAMVDRLYRSVRALRIYEGATDIQHLIIAGHRLKARKEGVHP